MNGNNFGQMLFVLSLFFYHYLYKTAFFSDLLFFGSDLCMCISGCLCLNEIHVHCLDNTVLHVNVFFSVAIWPIDGVKYGEIKKNNM